MERFIIEKFLTIYSISVLRYIVFAGLAFLIFYSWKKAAFFHKKIQEKAPSKKQIKQEIYNSLVSLFVFAIVGVGVGVLKYLGYTKIYTHFSDHSLGYFLFTVVFLILAHDAYFYWMHRAMHHKSVYRLVHKVHHESTNPTPWAAFSFHPLEAIAEVGIFPFFIFVLPLHPLSILTWLLFMTSMNVIGHLGFEVFPSGFTTKKGTRMANTSVHHNMHHKYVNYNYGLYFNFWDKMMGTNHPHYHETFEKVASKTNKETEEQLNLS